jgi:chromosome segregation ATPase
MKRGFEENVPRVRPRVRLGGGMNETGNDGAVQEESGESSPPQLELAPGPSTEIAPVARLEQIASVGSIEMPTPQPARSAPATESQPREEKHTPESRTTLAAPAQRAKRSVSAAIEVAQLAKDLTAELAQAAEANAQLRADLDAAVTALRRAAEESREQRLEADRLAAELDRRAAATEQLKSDLQLLEAERDGALGQVARLVRELREEHARAANAVREAEAAQAQAAQAREHVQRLTSELQARAAERDQARAAAEALTAERDSLSEALLAARAEADEAVQSRAALEEIHRALDEARTRVARLR